MKVKKCTIESFVVIGKEGATRDGSDFIKKLWDDANSNFNEVADLAKKDKAGNLVGIWGAMSDFSHSFKPWENNFSEGLYLAGVECDNNAKAPNGWVKWVIPSYEYLYVEVEGNNTFSDMISYLNENNILLVGAVHDFNCPQTGKKYMFFPIRRL